MKLRLAVELGGRSGASSPHKGLVLDRYLSRTEEDQGWRRELESVTRIGSGYTAYKLAFSRWEALAAGWQDCAVRRTGVIRGRMAMGLGIASVQEIGCRLHATYGVPVIPGSSLKGVMRARLEQEPAHVETAKALFGTPDHGGLADIYDAWWVPDGNKSGVAVDVVTVHHQKYYSGSAPPIDTESPIPVSFLTITGEFLFVISAPNESWAKFLDKLLVETLTHEGIGAKRNGGYGRFVFP